MKFDKCLSQFYGLTSEPGSFAPSRYSNFQLPNIIREFRIERSLRSQQLPSNFRLALGDFVHVQSVRPVYENYVRKLVNLFWQFRTILYGPDRTGAFANFTRQVYEIIVT